MYKLEQHSLIVYARSESSVYFFGNQSEAVLFQKIVCSARVQFKFTCRVNGIPVLTIFNCASNPTVEMDLSAIVNSSDTIEIHANNLADHNEPCYVSIGYSGLREEWERQFHSSLERTLED